MATEAEDDVWELDDDSPDSTFPVASTQRIQPSIARFEAVLVTGKITPKGEWEMLIKVPWSDREQAMAIAEKHGVMLDFRVTSKPGG